MIGTKLGHYKVTCQHSKGGMWHVYHAKDQKLGQDVAIKILSEECILSYLLSKMSRRNTIWRS
jgi:hypothetical protein